MFPSATWTEHPTTAHYTSLPIVMVGSCAQPSLWGSFPSAAKAGNRRREFFGFEVGYCDSVGSSPRSWAATLNTSLLSRTLPDTPDTTAVQISIKIVEAETGSCVPVGAIRVEPDRWLCTHPTAIPNRTNLRPQLPPQSFRDGRAEPRGLWALLEAGAAKGGASSVTGGSGPRKNNTTSARFAISELC